MSQIDSVVRLGSPKQKGDVVSVGSERPRYRALRENAAHAQAT